MAEEGRQPDRVWTSRKFVSAWCLTWIFTLMRIFDYLDNSAYSTCVSFVWVGYFAGNIGEKFIDRRK